jgi:hypothetical protein
MRGTLMPSTVALSVFCATACIARPVTVLARKACVPSTSASASASVPMSASVIVDAGNVEQLVGEQTRERMGFGAVTGPHAIAHGDRQADRRDHDGHHAVA